MEMIILAIAASCHDTSVAVLKDQELLQYLADNGITLEQIKDQMAKKEEG